MVDLINILIVYGAGQLTSVYPGKTRYKLTETLQIPHLFCFICRSFSLTSDSRINGEEKGINWKKVSIVISLQKKGGWCLYFSRAEIQVQQLVLEERRKLTCNYSRGKW